MFAHWISVNVGDKKDYVLIRRNKRDFLFVNPSPASLNRLAALPLSWSCFNWTTFFEMLADIA